jgi:hypothetical protein
MALTSPARTTTRPHFRGLSYLLLGTNLSGPDAPRRLRGEGPLLTYGGTVVQKEVQHAKDSLFGKNPTPDDPVIFDVLTKLYMSGFEDGKDEGCMDCEQSGNDAGYSRGLQDGAAGAQAQT